MFGVWDTHWNAARTPMTRHKKSNIVLPFINQQGKKNIQETTKKKGKCEFFMAASNKMFNLFWEEKVLHR